MKQKQLLSFLVCILMLSSCAAPTDSALDSGLTLRVYFADAEEIRLLPLEDYVFGALAAEMPANYAPEALIGSLPFALVASRMSVGTVPCLIPLDTTTLTF